MVVRTLKLVLDTNVDTRMEDVRGEMVETAIVAGRLEKKTGDVAIQHEKLDKALQVTEKRLRAKANASKQASVTQQTHLLGAFALTQTMGMLGDRVAAFAEQTMPKAVAEMARGGKVMVEMGGQVAFLAANSKELTTQMSALTKVLQGNLGVMGIWGTSAVLIGKLIADIADSTNKLTGEKARLESSIASLTDVAAEKYVLRLEEINAMLDAEFVNLGQAIGALKEYEKETAEAAATNKLFNDSIFNVNEALGIAEAKVYGYVDAAQELGVKTKDQLNAEFVNLQAAIVEVLKHSDEMGANWQEQLAPSMERLQALAASLGMEVGQDLVRAYEAATGKALALAAATADLSGEVGAAEKALDDYARAIDAGTASHVERIKATNAVINLAGKDAQASIELGHRLKDLKAAQHGANQEMERAAETVMPALANEAMAAAGSIGMMTQQLAGMSQISMSLGGGGGGAAAQGPDLTPLLGQLSAAGAGAIFGGGADFAQRAAAAARGGNISGLRAVAEDITAKLQTVGTASERQLANMPMLAEIRNIIGKLIGELKSNSETQTAAQEQMASDMKSSMSRMAGATHKETVSAEAAEGERERVARPLMTSG